MAVSTVRSAASRWRTAIQRRSQRFAGGKIGRARERRALPARRLPLAVGGHAARAVEQGKVRLLLR